MEVPLALVQCSSAGVPIAVPPARAATMSTPGAVMSGLTASSPTRGPRLEKEAIRSDLSTAPTVGAASALPGELTEYLPPPLLPAAMTKSVPVSSARVLTASSSGSMPGVSAPPMLMLTTSAFFSSAAHCIAASVADSSHDLSGLREKRDTTS
ncbi:hypothetical protein GCM10023238_04670 [Streptomyces heliomycini]